MYLLPFSDLHKEFMRNKRGQMMPEQQKVIDTMRATKADVILAAGDIDTKGRSVMAVAEIANGRPAVLVGGNHEFYGGDHMHTLDKLKRECEKFPNVHFLDDEALVLDDVVFLGATLWSDCKLFVDGPMAGLYGFQETLEDVNAGMNDYRRIKWGGRNMRVADSTYLHKKSAQFLEKAFEEYRGRKIVVVTHHAPSFKSILESYHQDILSAAYASNLDDLVKNSGAALWFHGHMHNVGEYTIGQTRVLTNCRGYADEAVPQFNPELLVEV